MAQPEAYVEKLRVVRPPCASTTRSGSTPTSAALAAFIEHSIDHGLQWVVFEPNNERLWTSVREQVEEFLTTLWRNGRLVGTKAEDAFFVRCDQTTMTQDDIDNGRLVVLIGFAPVRPAEFVTFRIGQWALGSDDDPDDD